MPHFLKKSPDIRRAHTTGRTPTPILTTISCFILLVYDIIEQEKEGIFVKNRILTVFYLLCYNNNAEIMFSL